MAKTYSIAQARHDLAALVHRLEREPVIQLTRRGKAVAVLLSQREFEHLTAAPTGFWNAYKSFRAAVDLSTLDIEPSIFTAARDKSAGREIDW